MKNKKWKSLIIYGINADSPKLELPLSGSWVRAGFPSPADDFIENSIDLNKELVKNPASTFYARVAGDSMVDMGIEEGDLLVIDKSLDPYNNCIAVCFLDGEFTLKRVELYDGHILLVPANEKFKPIKVTEDNDFMVWGVVKYVIKKV